MWRVIFKSETEVQFGAVHPAVSYVEYKTTQLFHFFQVIN